ncbi:MAG: hypothetical protein K9W45_03900 [Candidatus Heimdallarchaeum aukensis]|uniref:Uncharacterized protein n=1 Tax=Candidatus Heimdallarchaeum aukensis TaxID=2876573 RepID=A0A9Y1BMA4_9ARCH|nr:MAG: hypothetical protein K9W45_03900 [Candidatus Heimdallarchaeum aukensis]
MSDDNNFSSDLNNADSDFLFSSSSFESNLINGEKVFNDFLIPYRTISFFGLVVLTLSFLLPLIVILVVQFGTDFSRAVKYTIDVIMGLWLFFTFLFFFFIGSSNQRLIITNFRLICIREYFPFFFKKFRILKECSTDINSVTLVERKKFSRPEPFMFFTGLLMFFVSLLLFISIKIVEQFNISSFIQYKKTILISSSILLILSFMLIIYAIFFFSKNIYKLAFSIGQTYPLPPVIDRLFSRSLKAGYWVIYGWEKDSKRMYEEAPQILFSLKFDKHLQQNNLKEH